MLSSKVVEVKVGDVIRSLDFAGRSDCYMIGQVLEIKDGMITCQGVSQVIEGRASSSDRVFVTPQEGGHFMDQMYPGRITVL